jgi:C-terminal processing protease CtpA/Prc
MEQYFKWGREQLKDSMTETEFRKVLAFVNSKIGCGHTSIRASKGYNRYIDTVRIYRIFPISLKIWADKNDPLRNTAVITGNLNRKDSMLRRGTVITKINGMPMSKVVDSLFRFLPTDGYNTTHKYQTLSNRGFFGSLYTSIFGFPNHFNVEYIDTAGQLRSRTISTYFPAADTFGRAAARAQQPPRPPRVIPQPSRKERKQMRRNSVRLLKIDSASKVAMMDLSSFGRGYGLKGFFKRSFKALRKNDIGHLIIDVRSNGGGSVTNSTFLTRLIADQKFKIADSLYAVDKRKRYGDYIQNDFFNRLFMTFFTRKRKDGHWHFGYFEKHYFKPKKKNHYDGKLYILTGGNSFSATTLFASALEKQDNVTIVGEETGGGAYGNSAWLIPDVTLPNTKVRFRLPLFRLVIDKNIPKNGKGVQPEVESIPTVKAIADGVDYKVMKTMELIEADKKRKK